MPSSNGRAHWGDSFIGHNRIIDDCEGDGTSTGIGVLKMEEKVTA